MKNYFWILLTITLIGACNRDEPAPQVTADPNAERALANGEVKGLRGEYNNHEWRGIPFAQAPTGDLRWRAPQELGNLPENVGLEFGSPCPQYGGFHGGVDSLKRGELGGNEDCLYLNVYAPQFSATDVPQGNDALPVMVWIHGGGNTVGHAARYNGGNLAAEQNVIVVAINYRLGPLGWFRHAALRDKSEDTLDQSGNFGTLDHIMALKWVQKNISAFGGNPNNVTVFGESAGGRNTVALLLSPLAKGLFHRAIVQSGNALFLSGNEGENFVADKGSRNSSNEVLLRLLQSEESGMDENKARTLLSSMSKSDIAALLRATPADKLLPLYLESKEAVSFRLPNIYADGTVLPSDAPLDLFASGEYNRMPIIFGTNRDEQKTFMFGDPRYVKRWLGFLPRMIDEQVYETTSVAISKLWKFGGADAPAMALANAGAADVYVYQFNWDEEPSVLGADLSKMIGAGHGIEIPFVFGHFDLGSASSALWNEDNAPGRRILSRAMMSYWANFARTGAPGKGSDNELEKWDPWQGEEQGQHMIFDSDADGGIRMAASTEDLQTLVEVVKKDQKLAAADRCNILKAMQRRVRSYQDLSGHIEAICP